MTPAPPQQALEPVRAALLARARRRADQLRSEADDAARQLLAAARDAGDQLRNAARTQGEADARVAVRVAQARARQRARGIVLAAQREVYEELRRRAIAAVGTELARPAARARLAATLHGRLGPGAELTDTGGGGMTAATSDGRLVTATPEELVDRALAVIDLEQLWTSR
jgi:hypothetical protein